MGVPKTKSKRITVTVYLYYTKKFLKSQGGFYHAFALLTELPPHMVGQAGIEPATQGSLMIYLLLPPLSFLYILYNIFLIKSNKDFCF